MTLTLNMVHASVPVFPFAQIPCSIEALREQPSLSPSRPRTSAVVEGLSKMRDEAVKFQDWFDELDLAEVDSCSCAELAELVVSAPADFTRGVLFGKLSLRIQLAAITGRGGVGEPEVVAATRMKLRAVEGHLQSLAEQHQDWFAQLDFVDPDYCTRAELEGLMLSAPTTFVEGMMFGKLNLRIQMAGLTGRPFQ